VDGVGQVCPGELAVQTRCEGGLHPGPDDGPVEKGFEPSALSPSSGRTPTSAA
jgi:hypothetical protein